ncbi:MULTISPECIES: hypothetical protein [unclassified Microcoleus]|uniref:hypothetical protein n=1 Tax=unclassified Microcoleus TaxID=2642155 RepID=UPI002FD35BDB
MELSPLYLQRLEDAATRRGIQQGIQQSKRQIIESISQVRFGEIDEELAQIIEPLIQLETLDDCTRLIMQLDRSQLLARFQPESQRES